MEQENAEKQQNEVVYKNEVKTDHIFALAFQTWIWRSDISNSTHALQVNYFVVWSK